MGVLLVSDDDGSDAPALCEELTVAKSSISVALNRLEQTGLVERFRLPGTRRDRYRLTQDVFASAFRSKMAEFERFQRLAEHGLAVVGDDPLRRKRAGKHARHVRLHGQPLPPAPGRVGIHPLTGVSRPALDNFGRSLDDDCYLFAPIAARGEASGQDHVRGLRGRPASACSRSMPGPGSAHRAVAHRGHPLQAQTPGQPRYPRRYRGGLVRSATPVTRQRTLQPARLTQPPRRKRRQLANRPLKTGAGGRPYVRGWMGAQVEPFAGPLEMDAYRWSAQAGLIAEEVGAQPP
ncbi:hypothetical protein ITP53_46055 [Nonomuraea sp. K274]|uniref:MarR family protein n=1 Tax=Nonomuraea cypriaca TaxID=1187855 RepID=A0A931F696_9ACTN|nr:hypothetical protein [Nonomuraea cypriaca]